MPLIASNPAFVQDIKSPVRVPDKKMKALFLLASLLFLAGCNTQDASQAAPGARSLATKAGFVTDPGQPKDFVVKARPKTAYAYPEITPTPADPPVPQRSPAELKQLETRLDSSRKRSESYAKRPVPKSVYGGIAEARRAALGARARANKPIYVPGDGSQPTSYPVPEARRTGRARPTNPLAIPKE